MLAGRLRYFCATIANGIFPGPWRKLQHVINQSLAQVEPEVRK
jgi:hypothetical protein